MKEPEESLVVHCDAAWGNCALDRKSQSGFVTVPAGAAVSWESRKHKSVALSSTEAEYVAMSEATKEVIYLGRLLMELLGQPVQKVMYCDNQGAISLASGTTLLEMLSTIMSSRLFILLQIRWWLIF